ncbi:MAG: SusC/RagA family TonB-linked outer membrane protein [Reichenbachiella sp.]
MIRYILSFVALLAMSLGLVSDLVASSNNEEVVLLNEEQQRTVTGTVLDESGMTLPGVTVVIVGTTTGTITDVNGTYSILVDDGAILRFSFIGYLAQTFEIDARSTIDVAMKQDVDVLEEVVVTGYGQTQNKQLVSSAISNIKPKEMIEDRPIARLEQALQGATPAVVVLQESGSPGAPLTIRMRGVGTANNAQPLTLMNGFQLPDMSHINPNDVGGIQIFKDAASAAIYGARGANGVINMQNKSGHVGEAIVKVQGYYGIQKLATSGDYLSSAEYAEYYNTSVDYLIREGRPITGFRPKFSDAEMSNLPSDTWIERVSDDSAIRDLHVSISGGDEKSKYYISVGSFDQDGIIGPTGYGRNTANLNLSTKVKNNLEVDITASFAQSKRSFIPENSENSRLMSSVASLPGVYPTYNTDGDPFGVFKLRDNYYYPSSNDSIRLNNIAEFGNPIIGFMHSTSRSVENTLFGNALVKWEIVEGLKLNGSAGYLGKQYEAKIFSEKFSYPSEDIVNNSNSLYEGAQNNTPSTAMYYQFEGYLSYDKKVGMDHSVSAILGTSILHTDAWAKGRTANGLTVNTFDRANFAFVNGSVNVSPDRFYEVNTQSFYGRVQYNFKEKYLLDGTLRVDGSSNFGPENKWGVFPSVNAGWVLSEEVFLKSVNAISMLKLRASWGINGIDAIPNYKYVKTMSVDAAGNFTQNSFDEGIKWEEVTQFNIGVDLDLFKNKLGLTLDAYSKVTTDMLVDVQAPAYTGESDPFKNAATVRNNGLEVMLTYRDKISEKVGFNISLNAGIVKNEVTDLGGGQPFYGANTRVFSDAPDVSISTEGHPIASFFGFEFEGLDESGNPLYVDQITEDTNNDGVADATNGQIDNNDKVVLGSPYPKLTYGINLGLDFYGFDFTAFISGIQGNDVVNASQGFHVAYSNRTTDVLDAWSHGNTSSQIMRPSATEVVNHEFSDYYIEDGSYMRVKNLTLGYTIPKNIVEKIKVKNLRIYASVNNILTVTKYSGFDPEIGQNNDPRDVGIDRGFYPQARSFMGGFQLTF